MKGFRPQKNSTPATKTGSEKRSDDPNHGKAEEGAMDLERQHPETQVTLVVHHRTKPTNPYPIPHMHAHTTPIHNLFYSQTKRNRFLQKKRTKPSDLIDFNLFFCLCERNIIDQTIFRDIWSILNKNRSDLKIR
ncbi:unnamed protein product [Cuscuta epithymum]|uniref:Uncharacterized protein n=1 Tax=Cuscuta epithymum TaxID=186058 RepID=A0AAV0EHQ8_9ASTE|nr:unnamed protein product [Cuscuta epithymum]